MKQLDLFDIPPAPTSAPPASAFTIRTLLDERRGLVGDYQPGHFCESAADDSPFLEHHLIYRGVEFIGHVYRYTPKTPWHIAAVGEQESKVCDTDFDQAIQNLVSWRNRVKSEDLQWIQSFLHKKIAP